MKSLITTVVSASCIPFGSQNIQLMRYLFLVFTESSAVFKMVQKLILLREIAVFNIFSQFNINKIQDSLQ